MTTPSQTIFNKDGSVAQVIYPTPAPTPAPTFSNPLSATSGQADGTYGTQTGMMGSYIQAAPSLPAFSAQSSASMWGNVPGWSEFQAGGSVAGTDQSTWRTDLGVAAPPTGMAGIPAPAPAPMAPQAAEVAEAPPAAPPAAPVYTATATPAPAGNAQQDVANWYRNMLGRDPDAAGAQFWQDYYTQHGAQATLEQMRASANQVQPGSGGNISLADASKAYTGYQSSAGTSVVDEWARNMYGRPATPGEIAAFSGGDVQAQFERFKQASGTPQTDMTWFQASQLGGARPVTQPLANMPYGQIQQQYQPNLNSQVDARNETIEGRINNLMTQDQQGNYTNPVVRQAVDRAMQTFTARGLLNSSMAAQAGQEAAISKAIEIAGPDAEKYFQTRRANQDAQNVFARDETQQSYTERNNLAEWAQQDKTVANDQAFRERILTTEQSFTLRQNYIEANDNANARFNAAVNNINASNMTPADKSVAIAQATAVRDGDLAYNNNLFAAQPGFAREWLAIATPAAADIGSITNPDVLANIINDPAQPAAVREAARAKLAQLQQNPTPAPTTAPVAAPSGEVAV